MPKKQPNLRDLVGLVDSCRDLPASAQRQMIEAILVARLPGTDILNLLYSDLPSESIVELCIRADEAARHVSREELLTIVRQIMTGQAASEVDDNLLVEVFATNCRHPAGTDLIFYPEEVFGPDHDPTPEEVVAKALGTTE